MGKFLAMYSGPKQRTASPPSGVDLHVIFPPQWSPFQPFLSTPSLKAYLEQRGHRVAQSDWNVGFYNYFVSEARLPQAIQRLHRYVRELGDQYVTYRGRAVHALAVLQEHPRYLERVHRLRDADLIDDLHAFKESVDALQHLLDAFSTAEPVVTVGTSSLSIGPVLNSAAALDAFLENHTENPFIDYFCSAFISITCADTRGSSRWTRCSQAATRAATGRRTSPSPTPNPNT
jgi:anaerobic magnesium-protoporphyrin IX monomethyl ester cyclase